MYVWKWEDGIPPLPEPGPELVITDLTVLLSAHFIPPRDNGVTGFEHLCLVLYVYVGNLNLDLQAWTAVLLHLHFPASGSPRFDTEK